MSHVKQILLGVTGLCLTAAVIIIFLTSFEHLQEASNRLEQQAIQQEANIENYAILRYDNCTIYGSQLIIYLKNNWDSFKIVTLRGERGTVSLTSTENVRDIESADYIDNNALYHITVTADANGVPNILHAEKKE